MNALTEQASRARAAWLELQTAESQLKNRALEGIAQALMEDANTILKANRLDLEKAGRNGMSPAFIERLTLNEERILKMADGVRQVAALPDPVGTVMEEWTRPNGLNIQKVRVPLGVIGIIYESRPNVTVDAAALCLKSGNAVILRGGSDAFESNRALMDSLRRALDLAGLNSDCASLVMDTSRETVNQLMRLNGYVDVLIPRGGKGLIHSVVENATVPVIQTGDGVCHVYVDGACDFAMAKKVAVSAKISRPSVCNAAETLLVDSAIASDFLPDCLEVLRQNGVEIRGCERVQAICPWVKPADPQDWDAEYNDLIYAVKVVDGVDAAIAHINRHGTRHSEVILTSDRERARRFQAGVDAAAVYHNASTRFTDGGEFGFGAEIGISNQKLHARGPMGLRELTTYKYIIDGDGQIR